MPWPCHRRRARLASIQRKRIPTQAKCRRRPAASPWVSWPAKVRACVVGDLSASLVARPGVSFFSSSPSHTHRSAAADDSDSDDSADQRNVKYFVPKFTPEALDRFLLDLMLSIRTSVLNGERTVSACGRASHHSRPGTKLCEGLKGDAPEPHHFRDAVWQDLSRSGTDHRVRMVDYAPAVFQLIRDACGVPTAAYLLAWSSNDIKNSQVDGSELLYSCDKRYVAKLLTERDVTMVLDMLPRYFAHVRRNPHTLLLRMYGLVTLSKGKKMLPYLVAENIFHHQMPLHMMFHIAAPTPPSGGSGSGATGSIPGSPSMMRRIGGTLRRSRASSGNKSTLTRAGSTFAFKRRSTSLVLDAPAFAKDKTGRALAQTFYGNEDTWAAQSTTLLLEKRVKPLLLEQLERDLAFLQECEITEHKLVVGVHLGEPLAPPSPDADTKRMVKVPSMVVFRSDSASPATPTKPAAASPGRDAPGGVTAAAAAAAAGSLSPTAHELDNMRRARRVSVRSLDAEQGDVSPFRSFKGGLYSKSATREELYYLGITDIFLCDPKDKNRAAKAAARHAAFSAWLADSIEVYDDPSTPLFSPPKPSTATLRVRRSTTSSPSTKPMLQLNKGDADDSE